MCLNGSLCGISIQYVQMYTLNLYNMFIHQSRAYIEIIEFIVTTLSYKLQKFYKLLDHECILIIQITKKRFKIPSVTFSFTVNTVGISQRCVSQTDLDITCIGTPGWGIKTKENQRLETRLIQSPNTTLISFVWVGNCHSPITTADSRTESEL